MPWRANPDPSPIGPALIEVDANGNPVRSDWHASLEVMKMRAPNLD